MVQLPILCYGGEQEGAFHPSKGLSHAASRSRSEWKVGKLWQFFLQLCSPPIRVKGFRAIKKARITVHKQLTYHHATFFWNEITADRRSSHGLPHQDPRGRIDSH